MNRLQRSRHEREAQLAAVLARPFRAKWASFRRLVDPDMLGSWLEANAKLLALAGGMTIDNTSGVVTGGTRTQRDAYRKLFGMVYVQAWTEACLPNGMRVIWRRDLGRYIVASRLRARA
jgi:hypothetical protein